MRLLFILFVFILCSHCAENKSKQTNNTTVKTKIDTSKIKTTKDSSTIKIDSSKLTLEEKFLPLNDDNAMEFFKLYGEVNLENKVRIFTEFGNIDLQLFDNTEFHRANFIFLTKNKVFDGTQFHRVVENFIIQGGNSDNRDVLKKRRQIGRYLLPPDLRHNYKHDRGVISIPSGEIENAYKLASPFEFFITQKNQYHLDGKYTVFGKVIKGLDVVDKIAKVETDGGDWPIHNVYINKIEVID